MRTRLFVAAALVLGLATMAIAADPFVGTWKLNIAKSKLTPSTQAPLKEETQVVRGLSADQYESILTGTRTDGSASTRKFIAPLKGGAMTSDSFAKGESAFRTVINPYNFYFTVLQNGTQTEVLHVVISKDGKAMTATIRGTDDKGKTFEGLDVWDKQ